MLRNVFIALFLFVCAPAAFSTETALQQIPDAKIVGEGRLSFAFWDIYDATLYAPKGRLDNQSPFALSIRYMRDIRGQEIAERSVQEIRALGFYDQKKLATWHSQMKDIFPDVSSDTVLTALFLPDGLTRFYRGNQEIGHVKDAQFAYWFSSIWLSENTSEPELRRRLLGFS